MSDVLMNEGRPVTSGSDKANNVIFDNTGTDLTSTNVDAAIKEVNEKIDDAGAGILHKTYEEWQAMTPEQQAKGDYIVDDYPETLTVGKLAEEVSELNNEINGDGQMASKIDDIYNSMFQKGEITSLVKQSFNAGTITVNARSTKTQEVSIPNNTNGNFIFAFFGTSHTILSITNIVLVSGAKDMEVVIGQPRVTNALYGAMLIFTGLDGNNIKLNVTISSDSDSQLQTNLNGYEIILLTI